MRVTQKMINTFKLAEGCRCHPDDEIGTRLQAVLDLPEFQELELVTSRPEPGPCPATTEFQSVVAGPDAFTQRCNLRAGHAGDHEAALPHGGDVRWWDA